MAAHKGRKADRFARPGTVAGRLKKERLGSKNDPDLTGKSPGRRVAGEKKNKK